MSTREAYYEENKASGHAYNCAYAAGGDCTCGVWPEDDPRYGIDGDSSFDSFVEAHSGEGNWSEAKEAKELKKHEEEAGLTGEPRNPSSPWTPDLEEDDLPF